MPFTPTHIVAVLPLWPARRLLPFTALSIGSMLPDLPLFLPITNYGKTHATLGALTHCLPIGLVIYLLFEFVMRRPLTELLPRWVRARLRPTLGVPFFSRKWLYVTWAIGVAAALIIGALTHQVWDAFTHPGRWGTQSFAILETNFSVLGWQAKGYKLFQYGSTFVGLPLLTLLALIALARTKPITQVPLEKHTAQQVGVALFLVLTPCIVALHAYLTLDTTYNMVGAALTQTGAIWMLGLFAYCSIYQAKRYFG